MLKKPYAPIFPAIDLTCDEKLDPEPEPEIRPIPVRDNNTGTLHWAIVDPEDYDRVSKCFWSLKEGEPWSGMPMYQFILRTKKGQTVEHADGDKMNNRRSNLRTWGITFTEHDPNSRGPCWTKYAGVIKLSPPHLLGKYLMTFQSNDGTFYRSTYDDLDLAGYAYDFLALRDNGPDAQINGAPIPQGRFEPPEPYHFTIQELAQPKNEILLEDEKLVMLVKSYRLNEVKRVPISIEDRDALTRGPPWTLTKRGITRNVAGHIQVLRYFICQRMWGNKFDPSLRCDFVSGDFLDHRRENIAMTIFRRSGHSHVGDPFRLSSFSSFLHRPINDRYSVHLRLRCEGNWEFLLSVTPGPVVDRQWGFPTEEKASMRALQSLQELAPVALKPSSPPVRPPSGHRWNGHAFVPDEAHFRSFFHSLIFQEGPERSVLPFDPNEYKHVIELHPGKWFASCVSPVQEKTLRSGPYPTPRIAAAAADVLSKIHHPFDGRRLNYVDIPCHWKWDGERLVYEGKHPEMSTWDFNFS